MERFPIHQSRFTRLAGMAALAATVFSFTLLLDAPRMQLLVTALCLAGALLVGAVVLALVNRWWRNRTAKDDLSPSAQLAQFRSLYEAGEISQEEFERLRALLGARLRENLGVASPDAIRSSRSEVGATPEASPPAANAPVQPPPQENGQPPQAPPTDIRPA
jgi:hypothetical protein